MKLFRLLVIYFLLGVSLPAWAIGDFLLPSKGPYGKALDRSTKKGESYSAADLHAHLIWYATFFSDEFREAFRKHYDDLYPEGQEYLANQLAKPWQAQDPDATFFVAIYARKEDMQQLGNDKSLLDVTLETKGRFYKPKSVEHLPVTSFEEGFFPYVNLWYQAYRVVFPVEGLNDRSDAFNLHLNSVYGHTNLKFK